MTSALIALVPSAGVALLFYIVIKAMLEGDRRERAAQVRWDRERQQEKDKADALAEPGPEHRDS